jgi:hypothetical protein
VVGFGTEDQGDLVLIGCMGYGLEEMNSEIWQAKALIGHGRTSMKLRAECLRYKPLFLSATCLFFARDLMFGSGFKGESALRERYGRGVCIRYIC